MEELRDLNILAQEVVQNFNEKFDASDCKIPQVFKNKVKRLKSFSIVYNEYSVVVKGDGVRSKDSYVPNQCFFMASFFIEYSYELSKYKQKVMSLITKAGISTNEMTDFFTHERDNGKDNVSQGKDRFVHILDTVGYTGVDREFLIKFVTDYSWWSGNKTIDRFDFFNSPVLSIMGLTASSNSAIGLIVDYLTQNPDDSKLLLEHFENIKQGNVGTNEYQIIYFGAPGTGKSHKIKKQTEGKQVIRTTFHPDSDYSTFVGAYKPKTIEVPMRDVTGKIIIENKKPVTETHIVYEFVMQAFMKAYLLAWKKYSEGNVNSSTTMSYSFDIPGTGYYSICSVESTCIVLTRIFDFSKKAVSDEWPNLWKNGTFVVPKGPQSGKSVQHAIAIWIYNHIDSCSIDSFEIGWEKLMKSMETLGTVDVKKTQTYILSKIEGKDDLFKVTVQKTQKSKDNLQKIYLGKKSSYKLDNKLVSILKDYNSNDFELAWNKLQDEVKRGNINDIEAPDGEREPQFLVIEEINRGNCAQIFGDLFQLLDRSEIGFSTYPIEADSDLQKAISDAFKKDDAYKIDFLDIDDAMDDYTSNYGSKLSDDVREGRVLLLPPNLYIWATMNTSDQSLFPIDSAFKRRWDWVYIPIGYKNEGWTIEIGDKKYKWVDFQKRINEKIYDVDNSEDKQLGDYFVNADQTGNKISSDTLLNKILFYIWNDVCKDDPDQIFRWIDDKDNNQEKSIKFSDFFCDESERDRKLQGFMSFLGVKDVNTIVSGQDVSSTEDNTPTEDDIPTANDDDVNT